MSRSKYDPKLFLQIATNFEIAGYNVDSREVDIKQVVISRSVVGLMRLCYLIVGSKLVVEDKEVVSFDCGSAAGVVKADEDMIDIATADHEIEDDGTLVVTT